MIKAINTQYKGYNFRSRTEARWAIFFDTLGLVWEYEKEGFVLSDGTPYLPDFWLPDLCIRHKNNKGIWVEVKGAYPSKEEQLKCELLAKDLDTNVLLVWGEVSANPLLEEKDRGDGYFQYGIDIWDNCMAFFTCYKCGSTKVEFNEGNYEVCHLCGSDSDSSHPKLKRAVKNALSTRFEFNGK